MEDAGQRLANRVTKTCSSTLNPSLRISSQESAAHTVGKPCAVREMG